MLKPIYSFIDGFIFPEALPRGGELIEVEEKTKRQFLNVVVEKIGKIRHIPQWFDTLAFVCNFGRDLILYQIRPTTDPFIGRLVFLSQTPLVNDLGKSGRRVWDNIDVYFS